jgi:predicted SAM-dependent methyltransferase
MISKILNFVCNSDQHPPSQEFVSGLRSGLVNLGCGKTFHPDWDNFDLAPMEGVRSLNLLSSLPFEDSSVKACYSSHGLEHFSRSYAPKFLAEIFRVLAPGGIVRIVVPDLEQIARLYLKELDAASHDLPDAKARHEWMTMEMLDQMTRTFSGGFMGRLWKARALDAKDLIVGRLGQEAGRWIEYFDLKISEGEMQPLDSETIYDQPDSTTEEVISFRDRGEVHQWMYDRISLKLLLERAGFSEITVCRADESKIPDFDGYHLDTDEEGRLRKPDSLFMEGIR